MLRKQPFLRIAVSRIGNLLIRTFLTPGILDTQCGFKLFRAEAAKRLFALQTVDAFASDVEILHIAIRKGIPVMEAGIEWSDVPGSHFLPGRDVFRMLFDLLRIKWASILGKYAPR